MADVQQTGDIVEDLSARALLAAVGGVILIGLGGVMIAYGTLKIAGILLSIIGAGAVGFALYAYLQTKKVGDVKVGCPYCKAFNQFTEAPKTDFACRHCYRMVPVENGLILEVNQVRCGFCNTLNYWSARSFGLICEGCSREIPIAGLEGGAKRLETFAYKSDDKPYDLVLDQVGRPSEELIGTLQHMLALNRNQVKEILMNTPATLLTGIPKKKAELLAAQIAQHGSHASVKEHQSENLTQ